MNINVDGLNIEYTEKGTGAPILMLHGWGSSCEVYTGFINTLKNRCRLVAPDFPGCGKSDTMAEPWDLQKYCDFVLKFMAAVGLENPIMMGHSHGGRVALSLMCKKLLSVNKAVLFDSAGIVAKKPLKTKIKIKKLKNLNS
mgnify:CR=1 FL=1